MIPVYINNWNILEWVKNMTKYLEKVSNVVIVIIDNNSTYPPLLDWYKSCGYEVIRLAKNEGSRHGYWHVPKGAVHERLYGDKYFVFTDADLDLSNCPVDLMSVLKQGVEKYDKKCGLSIEVNDVPLDSLTYEGVQKDRCYWNSPLDEIYFDAPADTTFAMYHKDAYDYTTIATRANRPYTTKHIPWYFTSVNDFNEEEIYMYSQRPVVLHAGGQWTKHIYNSLKHTKIHV